MLIGTNPLRSSWSDDDLSEIDRQLDDFYYLNAQGKIEKAPIGDLENNLTTLGLDAEKAIPLSTLSAACCIHGIAKSMGIIPGLMIDGDEALMRALESRVPVRNKKAFVKEMIDHWNHCLSFSLTHAYADLYNPIGHIKKDGSPFGFFGAFELFIQQYQFGLARLLLADRELFCIQQGSSSYTIEDYIQGMRTASLDSPRCDINFDKLEKCTAVQQGLMILYAGIQARPFSYAPLVQLENLFDVLAKGEEFAGFDWIFKSLQKNFKAWLNTIDSGIKEHTRHFFLSDVEYVIDEDSEQQEREECGQALFELFQFNRLEGAHPWAENLPVSNQCYWQSEDTGKEGPSPIQKVSIWQDHGATPPKPLQFQYQLREAAKRWCAENHCPFRWQGEVRSGEYTMALQDEEQAGEYLQRCLSAKLETTLRPHQLFALARFAQNAALRDLAWAELRYRGQQASIEMPASSTLELVNRIQMLSLGPLRGDSLLPPHLITTLGMPREPIYGGWSRGGVFHRFNGRFRQANLTELSRVMEGRSLQVEERATSASSSWLTSWMNGGEGAEKAASQPLEAAADLRKRKKWFGLF